MEIDFLNKDDLMTLIKFFNYTSYEAKKCNSFTEYYNNISENHDFNLNRNGMFCLRRLFCFYKIVNEKIFALNISFCLNYSNFIVKINGKEYSYKYLKLKDLK